MFWNTVSALGDRDTTCAMAGGISILSCDEDQFLIGQKC
jgi:hypothetical protein